MDESDECNIGVDNEMPVDIIQMQQSFYEIFGYGSHLIYDCYASKVFVEMKIDVLLPGLDKVNKTRLIDMIWSQRSHRGNFQLLMSPIFVCVVYDTNITGRITYPFNIKSKHFSVHSLFRIQKCSGNSIDENGQNKHCAIFVDEHGRVYGNWDDFRNNNKYDDGLVIAPKMGIYNGLPSTDLVLLDIFLRKSGVTRKLDTGSTVIGLASAAIGGISLIPAVTIAPVVLGVATVAGVTCAVFTGLRSGYNLFDRKKHKQSIGLKNKEARGAWLNVGAGIVSASAAGATQLVARAARNGRNISTLARNSTRVISIGAIGLNTGACVDESFSIVSALLKREPISGQQMVRLVIALFLVRHSVSNFQAAKQLMATDLSEIESMTSLLCVSQKKSFKDLVGRTAKVCGSTVAKPVVRSLKGCLSDPRVLMEMLQMILRKVQSAEVSIEDMMKGVCGILAPSIVREYCVEFDKHVNKIIRSLGRKLNIGNLNSLLRPVINLLREMTFKACNKFLQFVEQFVIEIAQSIVRIKTSVHFERFLKMMHIKLAHRSAIEHTDLNSYILSKKDDELQSIDAEIRETISVEKVESLEQIESIYDETYGFDCDLSENRKLELLIDEFACEYAADLEKCSPAANTNELHETIVQIMKQLPYEMATKFFAIVKQLLTDHARHIQESLGRFISVDIFVVDIYCLLTKHCATNDCESLSEYLSNYTVNLYRNIEDEFLQNYVVKHDRSLKETHCSTCHGKVFV
ncbi:uncharacterized protein LOC129576777 [Sitodiplosis mosellana]|uniref:uncharacterized protein LOC129576777 n=1 Tax=Sitodiplosis mosellana TaxID=263140 RepID=UPI002444CC20|nr:uncharacterized protein LOC129576777 [Sitodiplosis mosellana]